MNLALCQLLFKTYFAKNCSDHSYNTRNKNKLCPAIAKHAYRDKDFRFISVHIWNYICDNISIDVSFSLFNKQSLKHLLLSERFKFQY